LFCQPLNDLFAQFIYKRNEFLYIFLGNPAYVIILHHVSFITAGIQIFGIYFVMASQDQRQCLNGAVMLQGFFRPIAIRIKQDCAKFQRGIVSNPKPPVGGNISGGILQISVDDPEKIRNFLLAGFMRTQPAVFKLFLQAHFRIASRSLTADAAKVIVLFCGMAIRSVQDAFLRPANLFPVPLPCLPILGQYHAGMPVLLLLPHNLSAIGQWQPLCLGWSREPACGFIHLIYNPTRINLQIAHGNDIF